MSPTARLPKYCRHKAQNKGYVTLEGRVIYFPGTWGSPESKAGYDQLIARWTLNGRRLPQEPAPANPPAPPVPSAHPASPAPVVAEGCTVLELLDAYLPYAEGYYVKDGKPTTQVTIIKAAFRILLALYESLPASEFGPKKLAIVRDAMIAKKWCRTTVIKHLSAIKAAFQWGTEQELVGGDVYHALLAVKGLRKNRSAARETEEVQPVEQEVVDATLPYLSPTLQAMAQVQLLTGMRPGEVCMLRGMDIKMQGDVWVYEPMTHKNAHHNQKRLICIGPRAQAILKPMIRNPQSFIFKSDESDRYTQASYRRAITRACERALVYPPHLARITITPKGRKKKPRLETRKEWQKRLTEEQRAEAAAFRESRIWAPNQLRHTAATRISEQFDLTASQKVLGHAKPDTTSIYVAQNIKRTAEIMRLVG
jgi:integrase